MAEHEVQQQMQRQPLRQIAFRKEFPPQKPRGKYGGFAVGPGGDHIALTAGQPAQRQRKRRQLRIQPAAHNGKDPLLRRHPPASFFYFPPPVCYTIWAVKYAPVAQLDRVTDSDSVGRTFESCRAYQKVLEIA